MSGLLMAWQMTGRGNETPSLNLADELTRLLDSIGDPTLTVGLSVPPMSVWLEVGQFSPVLTMAQRVIDYADGDLGKGRMLTISPLTTAVAYRGLSRALMGLPGWKDDFATAIAAADAINPAMRSGVIWIARMSPIANGVLLPDAIALRHTAEILAAAEQFGDNLVLDMARAARGITLSYCEGPEREEGRRLLTDLGEASTGAHVFFSNNLSVVKVHLAREKALIGDCDSAVDLAREGLDGLFANRQAEWTARGTSELVESLLRRGSDADVRDAQAAVDRLAAFPIEPGFVLHDIWLLRLRALMARARGDDTTYRTFGTNTEKLLQNWASRATCRGRRRWIRTPEDAFGPTVAPARSAPPATTRSPHRMVCPPTGVTSAHRCHPSPTAPRPPAGPSH